MSVKETVTKEITTAMKTRDKLRLTTLRAILAEITSAETSGKERKTLTDLQELAILRKMAKTRLETAKIYEQAGEPLRAEIENAEIAIIADFIPPMLSEADTEKLVIEVIERKGLQDVGLRGIGQVMSELKGNQSLDPAVVSRLAKKILAG